MPRVVFRSAAFFALAAACAFGSACGDSYGDGTPPSTTTPDGGSNDPDTGGSAGDAAVDVGADADAEEPRLPVPPFAFVVRKVFLGDTDRAGVASAQAWQEFGRNIDGVVSTASATSGECKPRPGASPDARVDGPNGLDNSFGKNLVPIFESLGGSPSATMNAAITAGDRTMMLDLDGSRGAFLNAEAQDTPPAWGPTASRLVSAEWMGATGPKSRIFTGGATASGVYESGDLVGLTLAHVIGTAASSKPLLIRAARFRMRISTDGLSATEGILSGVIPTADLILEVRRAAGLAGSDLCTGAAIDAALEQVRQASDVMQDGTQDPNKECDGISIGIGFEATRVVIGNVGPPRTPPPEPCP